MLQYKMRCIAIVYIYSNTIILPLLILPLLSYPIQLFDVTSHKTVTILTRLNPSAKKFHDMSKNVSSNWKVMSTCSYFFVEVIVCTSLATSLDTGELLMLVICPYWEWLMAWLKVFSSYIYHTKWKSVHLTLIHILVL